MLASNLFIALFLFSSAASNRFFGKKDTFRADITYVRSCLENNDNLSNLHAAIRKFNRTHFAVDMNITVFEQFDNTYHFDAEARIWGDGGWKRNYLIVKRNDACSTLYLILGPVWTDVVRAAGANFGCPVRPGFYHFENYNMDISKTPVISQPGRYYANAIVKKMNTTKIFVCVEVEVNIVPTFV